LAAEVLTLSHLYDAIMVSPAKMDIESLSINVDRSELRMK